jgi:hypothetical protein
VGARERPAAHLTVSGQAVGEHLLDLGRRLPVLQLAAVVVVAFDAQPAEEDVTAGLHQPLPDDDALAVVGELARARVLLEHRRLRLLDLQKQRLVTDAAEQQRDPGLRPDAADPDDLRARSTSSN